MVADGKVAEDEDAENVAWDGDWVLGEHLVDDGHALGETSVEHLLNHVGLLSADIVHEKVD